MADALATVLLVALFLIGFTVFGIWVAADEVAQGVLIFLGIVAFFGMIFLVEMSG